MRTLQFPPQTAILLLAVGINFKTRWLIAHMSLHQENEIRRGQIEPLATECGPEALSLLTICLSDIRTLYGGDDGPHLLIAKLKCFKTMGKNTQCVSGRT